MRILLLSFFCILNSAFAEPKPMVKINYKKAEHWTGQKISFYIELYSPTWFTGTQTFSFPEMKEVIIFKIPGSPVLGSEVIDGSSYSIQRHEFSIFSRRAGTVKIPPVSVSFKIGNISQKSLEVLLNTEPFTVFMKGQKNPPQQFITSENYSVEEKWDKETAKQFKTGDSLTRIIIQTSESSMGMLLKEPVHRRISNVSIYPAKPVISDTIVRGVFKGMRKDQITYIFEKPGSVTLPKLEYNSWSPKSKKFIKHTLPEQTISIAENPEFSYSSEVQNDQKSFYIFLIFSFLALTALLLFLSKPNEKKRLLTEMKRHAKIKDQKAFYQALCQWFNNYHDSSSILQFIKKYGSGELEENYLKLTASLFGGKEEEVNLKKISSLMILAQGEKERNDSEINLEITFKY